MTRYQVFAIVLIFINLVAAESALAQAQKGEMSPPKKKTLEEKSGRDPFLFPRGIYPLSKGSPSSVTKERGEKSDTKFGETSPLPLKVRAILISDHLRLATIDRFVVTVGDTIRAERVLEIKNDRVILGKGDKKRTLPLYQSPVKLTTEKEQ